MTRIHKSGEQRPFPAKTPASTTTRVLHGALSALHSLENQEIISFFCMHDNGCEVVNLWEYRRSWAAILFST